MIQAQKGHEALGWLPEIQRDVFCMCDPADQCLGGLEHVAAKSSVRGFGQPIFSLPLGPIHFHMAVTLLSCLNPFRDLTGLVKSHLLSYHALLDSVSSDDPCLHYRPLTYSPTKSGPTGQPLSPPLRMKPRYREVKGSTEGRAEPRRNLNGLK